jgi:hypothetical protein
MAQFINSNPKNFPQQCRPKFSKLFEKKESEIDKFGKEFFEINCIRDKIGNIEEIIGNKNPYVNLGNFDNSVSQPQSTNLFGPVNINLKINNITNIFPSSLHQSLPMDPDIYGKFIKNTKDNGKGIILKSSFLSQDGNNEKDLQFLPKLNSMLENSLNSIPNFQIDNKCEGFPEIIKKAKKTEQLKQPKRSQRIQSNFQKSTFKMVEETPLIKDAIKIEKLEEDPVFYENQKIKRFKKTKEVFQIILRDKSPQQTTLERILYY